MNTLGVVLSVIGGLGTIGGAFVTAWLTNRQSKYASDNARETAEDVNELDAWRSLAVEYRTRLERIEDREQARDDRVTALESEVKAERTSRESLARELDDERSRTTSLEQRFRRAVARIQRLLAILAEHDIEVPPELKGDLTL